MIGHLSGRLLRRQPPFLLLEVGGVGYELEAPLPAFYDFPADNQRVSLFVHHLVREDAQLLFGFPEFAQRELFRSLLKVTGVGPRVALAILSSLSAARFAECIRNADAGALARVPGIGKKTAERILFDLRERADALPKMEEGEGEGADGARENTPLQDAVGALRALGYKPADALAAVRAVEPRGGGREELIRNALQRLSK
ncbi:MAG: Holliday junction branch migration protein RuvA [Gammaproteobacteria bacterium]|nr:Holliday junction branch migration protein RuvA [Gammaproteobacteria bacterium]MDA8011655.1 Holliday junction branch migration protein RuvA [Gammaproteobacteria bacterium]